MGNDTIKFTFDLSGINKELKKMSSTQTQQKFITTSLKDAQDTLLLLIQKLAPKKTGKYIKSWKKDKRIIKNIATVFSEMTLLFNILEFTGANPQKRQRKPPQKPYVFKNKSGGTIFTFKINWPGFDAIPHVRPAMKRLEKKIPSILSDNMHIFSSTFK